MGKKFTWKASMQARAAASCCRTLRSSFLCSPGLLRSRAPLGNAAAALHGDKATLGERPLELQSEGLIRKRPKCTVSRKGPSSPDLQAVDRMRSRAIPSGL